MENNDTMSKQAARNQELAYIKGRQFVLTIAAVGSMLISFKIGEYTGELLFPYSPNMQFVIKNIFVLTIYLAIDWNLLNSLSSASNISKNAGKKRPVWILSILTLATTLTLSIASNFFISSDMAGDSHLMAFNKEVSAKIKMDSTLKMEAFQVLKNASKEEQERINRAKANKVKRIKEAVNSTKSQSWKEDYYAHKHNMKAWFWTCKECPRKYKQYRDRIKLAIETSDKDILEASSYVTKMQTTLSPTLSYQMQKDSTLSKVEANVLVLEAERKWRATIINVILLIMTIGCGLLAMAITVVLKNHREDNGQQIVEDNVQPILVIMDLISRSGGLLSDLLYNIIARPFDALKDKGFVKPYRLQTTTTHGLHSTTTPITNTTIPTTTKSPTPVPTRDTASTPEIVVVDGLGFVVHNGKRRDAAWCRKQLAAYESKNKKGEGHKATNDFRIKQFQNYLKSIDEMEQLE